MCYGLSVSHHRIPHCHKRSFRTLQRPAVDIAWHHSQIFSSSQLENWLWCHVMSANCFVRVQNDLLWQYVTFRHWRCPLKSWCSSVTAQMTHFGSRLASIGSVWESLFVTNSFKRREISTQSFSYINYVCRKTTRTMYLLHKSVLLYQINRQV